SSSCSPSPPPARQTYIRFEDMNKDLKNALRVSILFVYLPNCILNDLCFTISLKLLRVPKNKQLDITHTYESQKEVVNRHLIPLVKKSLNKNLSSDRWHHQTYYT